MDATPFMPLRVYTPFGVQFRYQAVEWETPIHRETVLARLRLRPSRHVVHMAERRLAREPMLVAASSSIFLAPCSIQT